jgi:hypothetical protein
VCLAQLNPSGYASFDLGPAIPLNEGSPAFNGSFSANAGWGKRNFVGIALGFLQFSQLNNPYLPVSLKLSALSSLNPRRTSALVVLEPGYGFYSESHSAGSSSVITRGGFTLFSAVGVVAPKKQKTRPYLLAGYAHYGFVSRYTTNMLSPHKTRPHLEALEIRAGVMF